MDSPFAVAFPGEMASLLGSRTKLLRLQQGWKRTTLAERAGVTDASLKRFENTGQASLDLVLKVAMTLARLEEFDALLRPRSAQSIEELEQRQASLSGSEVGDEPSGGPSHAIPRRFTGCRHAGRGTRSDVLSVRRAFLATAMRSRRFGSAFESGLFEHLDRDFGPLPGVFDDSLPDGWGLLLMDRHFRSRGSNLPRSARWIALPGWARGRWGADISPPGRPPGIRFRALICTCWPASPMRCSPASQTTCCRIARAGSSPAGARPKVLVGLHRPRTG